MMRTVSHWMLVLVVAITVMFSNLGATRLWDRDEPRNAGCAEEMIKRGDLVVPIFNDQLRDAKPALLYWLIMSAYQLFGVSEFAARFWSAILAVGTALGTYVIGRRLFNAAVGLWGAVILSSSLMFGIAGRAATPDSPLIFCSTMALMLFVLGTMRPKREGQDVERAVDLRHPGHWFPRNWIVVALMYAVMGVGILAKGPVGLIIPTAIIGMFLLIMRLPKRQRTSSPETSSAEESAGSRRIGQLRSCLLSVGRTFAPLHFLKTCWYMRPLTSLVVVALIAAPWFILAGIRTEGDYLEGFFVKEHFGRATQTFESHRGSVLFYPMAILACFFPWSVFAVPTVAEVVARIRRLDAWRPGYIFLACWIGLYVGVFTLAQTKLPSYVTPCYPALALLTACFIYHWTRSTQLAPAWLSTLAFAVFGLVGLAIAIGIPWAAGKYTPGEQWLGVIGLIPLSGAIIAYALVRLKGRRSAAVAFGVSAVTFVVALFGGSMIRIDRHQENHRLLEAIRQQSDEPSIASFGCLESSWVFYAKRPILELACVHPEEHAGPEKVAERQRSWHPRHKPDVQTFFATRDEPFLITTKSHLAALRPSLPPEVKVLAEARYFLKSETLVVLGRVDPEKHVADASNDRNLR